VSRKAEEGGTIVKLLRRSNKGLEERIKTLERFIENQYEINDQQIQINAEQIKINSLTTRSVSNLAAAVENKP
jgi:DNA-binding PadR family transcriptional regulator